MSGLPQLKLFLNTSQDNIAKELYEPCLNWAERYDRGVGFFTSSWFAHNTIGMSSFAARGGKMRLITSPIISNEDGHLIENAKTDKEIYNIFDIAMQKGVDALHSEMEKDVSNAFAWMIYDEIIDIRFAVPDKELKNGMFHDKFGIFYNGDNALSFAGSINDSAKGFNNYESIKIFMTWAGTKEYVDTDIARFNKLWSGVDKNLRVYDISEAVKEKIFVLRTYERPYKKKETENKWEHQDRAVDVFLEKKNGILAMATGTGKTRTAIRIIRALFASRYIKRVIITMNGNDLLDQWAEQISEFFSEKSIYMQYRDYKQMQKFVLLPDEAILLVSRNTEYLTKVLDQLKANDSHCINDTLLVFDEVHGAGSDSMVRDMSGYIADYKYRLGLSATPEREYDDAGNDFIEQEIGPVIFTFSLEDAIKKGILCGLNYCPLKYVLTNEERNKKRNIIKAFNYKKKMGEPYSEKDMWTQLALINKTAIDKVAVFGEFISSQPQLLNRCIIFVQTKEFGLAVQKLLFEKCSNYHTYYADDEASNLTEFAKGKLDYLITCQKISEGIDISSVENIILFASDRSKLVTTQRIGRALRLDSNNPYKVANIVDFILDEINTENPEEAADYERASWLTELSRVRGG